jgi:hypothetical protein
MPGLGQMPGGGWQQMAQAAAQQALGGAAHGASPAGVCM